MENWEEAAGGRKGSLVSVGGGKSVGGGGLSRKASVA